VYIAEAIPGDDVGFHVKGLAVKDLRRGYVASDARNYPAQETASFTAQVTPLFYVTLTLIRFIMIRSLYSITQVKSVLVMLQFSIVIQHTLLVSLLSYSKKSIVDLVKPLKKHRNSSNQVKRLW
jgi:hypothetical protein